MGPFESDIFTLSSLTAAINEVQYVPNQIGAMGIFDAAGVSTTSVVIEKDGDVLGLVPQPGAPGGPDDHGAIAGDELALRDGVPVEGQQY